MSIMFCLQITCSKKFQVDQHVTSVSHVAKMKQRKEIKTQSVQSFITTPTKPAPYIYIYF